MRHVDYSDDIPIPVFKESALSDTEPSEYHEETSELTDMNQVDSNQSLINHSYLIKRS